MTVFVARVKVGYNMEAKRKEGDIYGFEKFKFNKDTGLLEHDKKTLLFSTLAEAYKVIHRIGYIIDDITMHVSIEPVNVLSNTHSMSCIYYPRMIEMNCALS